MACENKMTGNVSRDCSYRPSQGVLEAYLINLDDIDKAACTATPTALTSLVLKAGAKIYSVDSVDTGLGLAATGARDAYGMAYTHTQRLRIIDGTSATWARLDELKEGNFVSIVKTKGASSDGLSQYKVGGFDFGMKMTADSVDYDAESGTRGIELTSQEGSMEANSALIYLDTDVATTEAFLSTNLFTA
tara:strand:+ start:6231 stop:6800 length:570 start_codon:yes stop_codon:yes gene_type:complete